MYVPNQKQCGSGFLSFVMESSYKYVTLQSTCRGCILKLIKSYNHACFMCSSRDVLSQSIRRDANHIAIFTEISQNLEKEGILSERAGK